MANFRPAGMSDDEDSDDEYFVSPAKNINQYGSSPARGRGRGRGAITIPWGEDESDSWGTSTVDSAPRLLQCPPGPSTKPAMSSYSSVEPRIGRSHEKSRSYNAISKPTNTFDKSLCLDSIPYIDKTNAELIYNDLKRSWSKQTTDEFSNICQGAFKQSENPYSLGLFLMTRSSDFFGFHASRTFSVAVIDQLKSYLINPISQAPLLDLKLQETAFSLVMKQIKSGLMKTVIDIFQIHKISDRLVESIEWFCSNGQAKEACAAATGMKLYCFDIHKFLIPLVLQDRLSLVEEYLEGSTEMQEKLLSYLDGLIEERYNLTNVLHDYIQKNNVNLKEVKTDKLNEKAITKIIKRLAEKYKIDPAFIPNVKKKQGFGELRHLFYRRYDQNMNMTEDNFHELLGEVVGNDNKLIDEAMYLMRNYNDYDSAVKFVQKFNIPSELIPIDILDLINGCRNSQQSIGVALEEEDWEAEPATPLKVSLVTNDTGSTMDPGHQIDQSSDFEARSHEDKDYFVRAAPAPTTTSKDLYVIPLSFESITMISSLVDVLDFCNYINTELENADTIVAGFDAEWKPVRPKLTCAALLQIAFSKRIFLVDIVALKECEANEQKSAYENIMCSFFANEKVFKLGYDISHDLKKVSSISQEWLELGSKIKSVLDLHVMKSEILKRNTDFFLTSVNSGEDSGGLSELLDLCLQKKLSKTEQFSDWERRPLKQSQVIYASADAYCLVQIFKFMQQRETEVSIGLNEMVNQQQRSRLEPTRKRQSPLEVVCSVVPFKKPHGILSNTTFFKVPRLASDVKILCDNMLQGLGKQLRRCGINTEIVEPGKIYFDYIDKVRKENRYVLTKGKTNFKGFSDELPLGNVYYMKSDYAVDQLEEIFNYFNIIVDEADSFTFCQQCNTKVFIKVSNQTIRNELVFEGVRVCKSLNGQALVNLKKRVPEDMITYTEEECQKNWVLRPESDMNIQKSSRFGHRFFASDVAIDLNKLPTYLINYIDAAYACTNCGKCYWNSKILQNLLLTDETENQHVASSSN